MARCCFNKELKEIYRCEYEITEECITVDIEYDVYTENTTGIISSNDIFKERDILIVDSAKKKSFLLKNAIFGGKNSRFGTIDSIDASRFFSYEYFEAGDGNALCDLFGALSVKSLRIYSEAINDYYYHPSVVVKDTDDTHEILLQKERKEQSVILNDHNIEKIYLGDDWHSVSNNMSISIDINGYFGISFINTVDHTEIYKYIREVMIYMQLFYPGKFIIKKMSLEIDGKNYWYVSKSTRQIKHSSRIIDFSVKDDMLTFLKNCYIKMPYRDTEGATRNIPYVVMRSYRNIEDNFLMSFRFLEYYYKAKNPKWKNWKVIKEAIKHHYKDKELDKKIIEKEVREIVALRNHYVHSGYYIHETKLLVTYKEGKLEKKYYVDANVSWLRDKAKMLQDIVIDVIFTELLGYQEYNFRNIF